MITEPELQAVLEKATRITAASGATIVLGTGNTVCCRNSKGSAPEVRTLLQSGVSLAGPCLATGEIMLSNDTYGDPRLDPQLCEEMGIRSVLALPIKRNAGVMGVLEVVSVRPDAFNQRDAAAMRELTKRVGVEQLAPEFARTEAKSIAQVQKKTLRNSQDRRLEATTSRFPLVPTSAIKSTAGIKTVTVFLAAFVALTVVLATIVDSYSRRHSGRAPHSAIVPSAVPKHDPIISQQHLATEQSNTWNAQPKPLDSLLTASREEVLLAIREAVQAGDVNGILERANGGDSIAQYEMALRYADGEGVSQNYGEAMGWFAKAAARGNAKAQWKLALGYLRGIGVPQNEGKAVLWLKRAANSGEARAQTTLSDIYFTGRGVPRDYVRAYTWANIAAESQENDPNQLAVIRSQMTPAQIADAERRTSIWRDYASRRVVDSASSENLPYQKH
jgi:TPR repeat protein